MHADYVVAEFGRRMGLPDMSLDRDKPVQLHIAGMGTLFMESAEGEILVYLARNFPSHDREVPRRALLLCRPDRARPFPVYAGLYKENTLLFLTRFSEERFSVQSLEQAVIALSSLLDQAVSGEGA
jgi:type III secretion system chaperone SycN